MLDLFRDIVGDYEPIQSVVSGSAISGDFTYQYSIDWSYIFTCILFCIVVYSIFRLIGILLGGSNR